MLKCGKLKNAKCRFLTNWKGFAVDSEVNCRVNYIYDDGQFGILYGDEGIWGSFDDIRKLLPLLVKPIAEEVETIIPEAIEWRERTNG